MNIKTRKEKILESEMVICMKEMWEHLKDVPDYKYENKDGVVALKSNINVPWLNYSWIDEVTEEKLRLLKYFFGESSFLLTINKDQNKTKNVLEEEGFEYSCEVPDMILNLKDFPYGNDAKVAVKIKEVKEQKELEDWIKVAAESADEEEWSVGNWVRGIFKAKKDRVKFFLGTCNGEPAVTSMVFQWKKLSVLFYVGTLIKYRKQGLGQAILKSTFEDCLNVGVEKSVIYATEMAPGFYEKLGFKLVNTHHEYWRV